MQQKTCALPNRVCVELPLGQTSRSLCTQIKQSVTEDGVLKYVLRKEEYEGVLGKDMHATTEQVKSLIMDFTRLIDDAASVTNTPKH